MEPSDADLWARSRARDRDAFGQLFERHAKLIYNYCFRRVGNRATAQDLLSMVFLEAWRRRDKELPADKVLPWLYGIATNVVRHQHRSERRYAAALKRLPTVQAEPDFAGGADERLDYEWQAQDALRLLGMLPRREQDVFVLCVGMELSYEDAAVALGVPLARCALVLHARGHGFWNSILAPGISRVRTRTCRRHASHDRPDFIPAAPRSRAR